MSKDRQKELQEWLAKAQKQLSDAQDEFMATPAFSPASKRAKERMAKAYALVEQLRKEVGMVSMADAIKKATMGDYV